MVKAGKAKEISVKVENMIGAGAALIGVLAIAEINVIAFIGWSADSKVGVLQFITDDYAVARKELKRAGYELTASDVVWLELPNRPGALAEATEKLAAAEVDISYAYATATVKKSALAVFKVNSPAKALRALMEDA